jgi:NTE family protein
VAHAGVIKVLVEEGIPIDMISGTSMGAIVGGLYCAGTTPKQLEDNLSTPALMKHYMTVSLPVRLLLVPFFAVPHLFGWKPYDGFYFGNKFRCYLEGLLPTDRRTIESLKTPFTAVSTNLVDGEAYCITKGNLAKAMQASSAIPILRRPVPMEDGSLLADGAVVCNVPVDAAKKMGADIVIAVDVDENLCKVDRDKFRKIGSVGKRIEQIFLAHVDEGQIERADIVIHPDVDGIGLLSEKKHDAMAAIKAGEAAARAALPMIRARLKAGAASTAAQAPGTLTD